MTTDNNKTPLWLDLRKEYIDDNFEKLLDYLNSCWNTYRQDNFYQITIDLLKSRIEDLINTQATKKLYDDADDHDTVVFHSRLLASYLLLEQDTPLALSAYIALMDNLRALVPKSSDDIVKTTLKRLQYEKVLRLGYSWKDVKDFQPGIFSYHIVHNSEFGSPLQHTLKYACLGTALLTSDGLSLYRETEKDAVRLLSKGSNSLDTKMGVSLRTPSGDKLKQSQETNLPAMDEFVKDFIHSLSSSFTQSTATRPLFSYDANEEVIVVVSDIDSFGKITVETTDPKYYPLKGEIVFHRPNVLYYKNALFAKYIKPGQYITATIESTAPATFNFENQFIRFVVEDCRNEVGQGEDYAKLLCKNSNSLVWIDNYGVPLYSRIIDGCNIGDYATLQVKQYQTGDYYGKIETDIVQLYDEDSTAEDEVIDIAQVQQYCIENFVKSTAAPQAIKNDESFHLPEQVLSLLTRMFFEYQKTLLKPSEKYLFLGNANVMAEMTGDTLAASYIRFVATYLRVLVQFVANESISNINLVPDESFASSTSTHLRLAILQLLKEYGKTENSDTLADTITNFQETQPMLARLARLIQTANSMQGVLSDASVNVIKREIIKTLSIETADDTDLEADGGTYLGLESGTQEFKTSFVYPADSNMLPSPTTQENNVFKGICAFLNSSTGGTLFLGVNDQGYVVGLDNDFAYLKTMSIDAYIRHIQDRAKKVFDTDGIVYLKIEPMYDNRVVAIHVEPHPYRVVELNDVAYIRVNNESREMSEKLKQEMLAKKVLTDRDKAAVISRLQFAYSKHKVAVLHNYSSSNSVSVSDRIVEAYDIRPNDDMVIAYEENSKKCKVFKLNRIGYVEVTDKAWTHQGVHEQMSVDAFHISGNKPIEVSLKLDIMAKNLLAEEYPRAKDDLTNDKKDNSIWYYTGKVYSIVPIARFYMGLADHITILDCEQLVHYVKSYVDENFAKYK